VSFLDRVFGKQKPAPGPYAFRPQSAVRSQIPAEFLALVTELTAIGNREGFLAFRPGGRYNQQCRHIRAREIGMKLNMAGGSSLMRRVYDRVDCQNVRQLAAAWDEIGHWVA
jgi:hypothetical protein